MISASSCISKSVKVEPTLKGKNRNQGFEELEKLIMTETRKIYSEKTIDHALKPQNVGRIKNADGFAMVTGPCGDTMEITVKVDGERVVDAAFWTDGCGTTIACGSVITELVKGKNVAEALKIDSKHVLATLGGLPESDVHCSVLASITLNKAIKNYLSSIKCADTA